MKHMTSSGLSGELEKNRGKTSEGKSLEDWLKYKPDSLHKFQIRIVSADLENQTFLVRKCFYFVNFVGTWNIYIERYHEGESDN